MAQTIIPILGSICLIAAALLTLLLFLTTKGFTASPPQGADAMGLVVVMFGMGGRWLLMLVPAILCLWRGSFDWISPRPSLPTLVVLAAMLGFGVLFAVSWIQWTYPNRWYTPWVGNLGACVLPLAVQGYLAFALWSKPDQHASAVMHGIGGLLLLPAAIGLGSGGYLLWHAAGERTLQARQDIALAEAEHAEFDRRAGLSRTDRLREDLDAMPPGSQFWQIAGYFEDCETPEQRRMVAALIDQFMKDDEQLRSNLTCQYASFRHRAAVYLLTTDRRHERVGPHLAKAMELLADTIAEKKSLLGADGEDYAHYVQTLTAAARRFPEMSFDREKASLRTAIEALPASEERAIALAAFAPAGDTAVAQPEPGSGDAHP